MWRRHFRYVILLDMTFDPNDPISREHLESELANNPEMRPVIEYVETQESVLGAELRQAGMPMPPWPDPDNVMLKYLLQKADEIANHEGLVPAIMWLGTHAWFEGSLEGRAVERAVHA